MAACPAAGCDGVDAASLDWFKISEHTNDGSKWASDTIVSTLKWSFDIPSDLAAGPYLVRHEIIAMHTVGEPQVYPYCFQANLLSSGSAKPADTVKFPAAYTLNPDFRTWNLYNGESPSGFNAPGPAVYGGGGSGGGSPAPAPVPSSSAAPAPVPSSSEAAPGPSVSDAAPAPVLSSSEAAPAPSVSDAAPAPSPSDGGETTPSPADGGEVEPGPVPTSSSPVVSSAAAS